MDNKPTLFRPLASLFLLGLLVCLFIGVSIKASAQAPTAGQLKAVVIYKVIQLSRWPNEANLSVFDLGVYGASSAYIADLNNYYGKQKIRGKSIKVAPYNPFKDSHDISALLVSENKIKELVKIIQATKGRHILVFSESSKEKRHVMINLTQPNSKDVGFEINRSNIILEGLKISKDIVLAGGSELDVAKIYKETVSDLTKTKEILDVKDKKLDEQLLRLNQQTQQLNTQNLEIKKQKQLLANQLIQIKHKDQELTEKEARLDTLKIELNTQLETIKASSAILDKIETKLKSSKQSLLSQETENLTLAQKIRANVDILAKQKESLKEKEQEINIIGQTVTQQKSTITMQKYFLLVFSLIVSLVIILSVVLYRSFLAKKKSSALIEEKNTQLEKTMGELTLTQEQLLESEKMASLGGLIKGIAHEVNTPAGIVLTADSSLLERTIEIREIFNKGEITQANLAEYLDDSIQCTELSLANIRRVAELIQTFKKVAVDQSSNDQRSFNLAEYIEQVIVSTHSLTHKGKHTVNVSCPEDLVLYNYPGAFAQIISILISNSVHHGFVNKEHGMITFDFSSQGDDLVINFEDDGVGASQEVIDNIFEPFYTTTRGSGGSGLGAHILFNLVTQLLMGNIKCTAGTEQGLHFEIIIPMNIAPQEGHKVIPNAV